MNKPILVTGGAGFVGSHLVDALISRGESVLVLDDLSTGTRDNLTNAERTGRCLFIDGSVMDEGLVGKLMGQVDRVYHLAASVGVKLIVERLVGSIENNVRGTEIVLRAANVSKAKVLITSTSEVYGRSTDRPFCESDDLRMGPTTKARWSYACSKALDEYIGFAYWQEHHLPVTAVRLFNTVGERQTDSYGMVVPTFVRQAITGVPLTVHGSGGQSRTFCHVFDVAEGLIHVMNSDVSVGEVFNIGSRREITMLDLARLVIDVLGSSSDIKLVSYGDVYPEAFDDIQKRVPNIDKMKRYFDWEPEIGLEDIIVRVANALSHDEVART